MKIVSLRYFLLKRIIGLMGIGILGLAVLTTIALKTYMTQLFTEKIALAHNLFVQNIRQDILLGAHHQVDQKCENYFKFADISEIAIYNTKNQMICQLNDPLKTADLNIKEFVYFDEMQTQAAATIEGKYSFSKLKSYTAKIVMIVVLVVLLSLITIIIFILNASRRITNPIGDLVSIFAIKNLNEAASAKSSSSIKEILFLYEQFRKMIEQILEAKQKESHLTQIETYASVTKQVSHDIRSPLSALNLMVGQLQNIPEQQRLIIRNSVNRINDIANTLLQKGKEQSAASTLGSATTKNPLQVELLPALVDVIVSEKRVQFRDKIGVQIEADLNNSYGAFANIDLTELKRALSNLTSNSVEALPDSKGRVVISVKNEHNAIKLSVIDNGKGIPEHVLKRLGEMGVTHGKECSQSGSGLGVYHAKKTIESCRGEFLIDTKEGQGTTFTMVLPRVQAPKWFVEKIQITRNAQIVSIDDDLSIHSLWQERLEAYIREKTITHFTFSSILEFKNWSKQIENKANILYLVDYEFLGQPHTGLDLIEELGIGSQSILVTSRYEEIPIKTRCEKQGVKLIPKGMSGFVPIEFAE